MKKSQLDMDVIATLSVLLAIALALTGGLFILAAGVDKVLVLPLVVVTALLLVFISRHRPAHFLYGLAFFNIAFLALYYPLFGHLLSIGGLADKSTITWVVGARSATIAAALCLFLLLYRRAIGSTHLTLLGIALTALTISFLVSEQSLFVRLIYLVNSFLPLILCMYLLRICLTSHCLHGGDSSGTYAFIALALGCSIIGFAHWFYIDALYDLIRPDLIASARSRDGNPMEYGSFPNTWYSRIGSFQFERMTGTFPDPIQWGYACASFTFALAITAGRAGIIAALPLLGLVVLSGSKGAMLFLGSSSALFFLHLRYKRHYRLGACSLYTAILLYASLSDSSVSYHLQGLVSGLSAMLDAPLIEQFIGHGLGSGGNFSLLTASEIDRYILARVDKGAESGLGVLAYQTGLFGIGVMAVLLWQLHRAVDGASISDYYKSALHALLTGYFINFTLQENLLNSSILLLLCLTFVRILAAAQTDRQLSG